MTPPLSYVLATINGVAQLDLMAVFQAAPVIYSLLFVLSIFSCSLWGYSLLSLRANQLVPPEFLSHIRYLLKEKKYDDALESCQHASHYAAAIVACGLTARQYGHRVIMETMETEGKRCGVSLWQRLALINDVVVVAPMIGLLGTVVGLFYAFYDVHQTPESLISIFDGLGVAIGTTVAGLIVAIMSMLFHASLKFRIIQLLATLENETKSLGHLIEAP